MDSNTPDIIVNPAPLYYVGIGASAGGLEAIELFFKKMPIDSGLAFVVVQQLSPDYKSLMLELLSKHTAMPIFRAEDGMTVCANTIYLIPPKKNLRIFHGKLILEEQDYTKGINLPIDIFLHSLADDQGEKSVAIILSGTGSDGMRGVRRIKECGGMAMVQDELSAKFDGMPKSAISTGLVDFILAPAEMPDQLQIFVKHPYAVKAEMPLNNDEDSMARIFSLLREKCQVDFTFYKPSTVVRRIERRMNVNQVHTLADYAHFMEYYPKEVHNLYRELLIGVTNFFRDKDAFDILARDFLPKMISDAGSKTLRFWVAGCSTGEEAYTFAMICQECMDLLGKRVDVKIFATDVDKEAIAYASNGVYPESIAGDLSAKLLSKYFLRKNEKFHVTRNIREMVVFAQHNLIKDPPFTNISLISCRNLLIYLQPVLQRKVFELFAFSLTLKGILMLGASETTGDMSDYFDLLHHKWKIYQAKGKRQTGMNVVPFDVQNRAQASRLSRIGALRLHEEERVLERMLKALADNYLAAGLVVNEQLELMYSAGKPEEFFKLPQGKMLNDVTKMANRDLAIPLAVGVQRAFSSSEEVKYTNIYLHGKSGPAQIDLRILRMPEQKGQLPLVAVFLEYAGGTTQEPRAIGSYDVQHEASQRIQDLEQELQFTRENLQATVEELETSNEELQATNEELLASNEELQSTNEELQSVNEELYTVNAEYHNKIVELSESNNDLDNLLKNSGVITIFLDEEMNVRRYTYNSDKIFKIIDSDIGRPFHHIVHAVKEIDLNAVAHTVLQTRQSVEREICTVENHWYLLRALPYRSGSGVYAGIVFLFVDIHETKANMYALQRQRDQLERVNQALEQSHADYIRTESILQAIYRASPIGVGLVKERRIVWVNTTMERLTGYSEIELAGQSSRILYPDDAEFEFVGKEKYAQIQSHGRGTVKTRWRCKDGAIIEVILSSTPWMQEHPEDGHLFSAFRPDNLMNF